MTDRLLTPSIPTKCVFCKEAKEPRYANRFLGNDWPFPGRRLVATRSMYAVPGYGPQVYPYALIVSIRHFNSLAEAKEEEIQDVFRCLKCLISLKSFGGKLFVFEHASCGGVNECMDHFHLHVIPGSYDLRASLEQYEVDSLCITPGQGLEAQAPYLLAGTYGAHQKLLVTITSTEEKKDQFFRRALAHRVDSDQWDWRLGMNKHYMERLVREAKMKF